jgi:hypothetical protein
VSDHTHFIDRCKRCDVVLAQCRCMDRNKTVRREHLCAVCAKLPPPSAGEIQK